MTLKPGDYDITIYQGATLSEVLTWKDENGTAINLTGYTAQLMVRTGPDDTSTFISLATGSGITLGGSAGTITVAMTAADTAALTAVTGEYDLKLTAPSGDVYRLLHGSITVVPAVTR